MKTRSEVILEQAHHLASRGVESFDILACSISVLDQDTWFDRGSTVSAVSTAGRSTTQLKHPASCSKNLVPPYLSSLARVQWTIF